MLSKRIRLVSGADNEDKEGDGEGGKEPIVVEKVWTPTQFTCLQVRNNLLNTFIMPFNTPINNLLTPYIYHVPEVVLHRIHRPLPVPLNNLLTPL